MHIEPASRPRAPLSLTPVIDVVFLLLLFFMLSSTFSRYAHIDINVAGKVHGGTLENSGPAILLSVRGDGSYAINGDAVSLDGIADLLEQRIGKDPGRILVRPASDASAQQVISAIEAAEAARLGPVLLVR